MRVPAPVRRAKRIIVALVGSIFLVVGIFMIVLPGPALLLIPLGLGILATEFQWAQRILAWMRETVWRSKKERRGR